MEPYQIVLEELLKVPGSLTAGEDEIRMHCPRCNHQKPKLYVGLNRGLLPRKVLMYDCKHCNFQGGVGAKFLKMFNIDVTIGDYVKSIKKVSRSIYKTVNPVTKMVKNDFKIPDFIRLEDQFKIDYLSRRFGRKLTINDIKTYKIVLNFKDFCNFNKINPIKYLDTNDPNKIQYAKFLFTEYTKHFVGMLSIDNNKINFRNINSEALKGKRYMVHVFDKKINNPYMYMPDIPFDILAKQPIINMAEGNYDIIGAKELYFSNEDYSNIFVAVGTRKAYKRALMQIMKMTGFLNAKLNIFADNDLDATKGEDESVNLSWYRDMFKDMRILFNDITINYNVATDSNGKPCKDFGNLSNPIELVKYEI